MKKGQAKIYLLPKDFKLENGLCNCTHEKETLPLLLRLYDAAEERNRMYDFGYGIAEKAKSVERQYHEASYEKAATENTFARKRLAGFW